MATYLQNIPKLEPDSYFARRLRGVMDACAICERTRSAPEPQEVLGLPVFAMRGEQLHVHRDALDVLKVGNRLERLAKRLEIIAAERDVFLTLKEMR